jgi:hypothetical protein
VAFWVALRQSPKASDRLVRCIWCVGDRRLGSPGLGLIGGRVQWPSCIPGRSTWLPAHASVTKKNKSWLKLKSSNLKIAFWPLCSLNITCNVLTLTGQNMQFQAKKTVSGRPRTLKSLFPASFRIRVARQPVYNFLIWLYRNQK